MLTYHIGREPIHVIIPEQYNSIAICMSGGMDSALLAALLFPQLDLSKVTVWTVDNGYSPGYVVDILKHLGVTVEMKTLPYVIRENGTIDPDLHTLLDLYDYVYTGSTANPDWASSVANKPNRHVAVGWRNMMYPFGKTTKAAVIAVMLETNNMHLLPFTHTCTADPINHCGECFACRERKWAFEVMQVPDVIEYLK